MQQIPMLCCIDGTTPLGSTYVISPPTEEPAMSPLTTDRPTGIPVRRSNADLANADVERWTVPGDPVFSHFMAALSSAFPNGEDFFVQSVRNYRDRITDADTRAKVRGFIGQEAMHGREHRALNARLAELGYPTEYQEHQLLKAAARLRRLPAPLQLAVTAAAEHFTSVLAHPILSDAKTRETLFPAAEIELLVTWHALEELEHKDVAFDVLADVDGRYVVRAAGLGLAAVGFGLPVLAYFVKAVAHDRHHLDRAARRQHLHNRRNQRMFGLHTLRHVLTYLRPGFHPRDVDTDDLVTEWRDRLAAATTTSAMRELGDFRQTQA